MKNKWLLILLGLTFIKGIIWIIATPIFQVPDEASHFALIQILAETGKRPNPRRDLITSQEIFSVSEIVRFNWKIQHPVWQHYPDDWQQQVAQISPESKNVFVRNPHIKSLKRPPLYYLSGSLVYRLVKNTNFLVRFFTVRSLSLVFNLFTVWLVFKLAGLFFKNNHLNLAAAALVAFQPMLSFIDAGVHYDSLTVLVATLFLYLYLNQRLYWAIAVAILGLFINPSLISLSLILFLILFRRRLKFFLLLGGLIFACLVLTPSLFPLVIKKYQFLDPFLYLINLNEYGQRAASLYKSFISGALLGRFWAYLLSTAKINLAQVFPWYWGVFGWLEKTFPLLVYRLIKLVIIVSLVGWGKYLSSRDKVKGLFFLVFASIINLAVVVLNDFLVFAGKGENFGIQGRYLLPFVAAHIILLLFGLDRLVPSRYTNVLAAGLILAGFALNLAGLACLYQYFGWVWS